MHGAADNLPILGEDGLHVGLGDQQGVEVTNEDAGIEGAGVRLVGHVAAGHQAGGGGRRPTRQVDMEGGRGKGEEKEKRDQGQCLEGRLGFVSYDCTKVTFDLANVQAL